MKKYISTILLGVVLLSTNASALNIKDYYSPRNRERPRRAGTKYIILHTTEGAASGSLKKIRANGEAHYMVADKGTVYRIISRDRVAFHAGRSMWNGRSNIDNYSIGIEISGYHNRDISSAQYRAVKELIEQLQRIYKIPDERVLTHSMVAYGAPNQWHKHSHRGRKRCGMQFARRSVRLKLGLTRQPTEDPDIKSGRLIVADSYLAKVLYGSAKEQEKAAAHFSDGDMNVIDKGRSAWDVARDKYNDPDTTYIFPDGRKMKGNKIKNWKDIPPGTKVILSESQRDNLTDHVKEIGVDGDTAQEIAGNQYNDKNTIYILPNGKVTCGSDMKASGFNKLQRKTRILIGYTIGGRITGKKSAFDICGKRWNFPSTYYLLQDGTFVPGNRIKETAIPKNAQIFFRD